MFPTFLDVLIDESNITREIEAHVEMSLFFKIFRGVK